MQTGNKRINRLMVMSLVVSLLGNALQFSYLIYEKGKVCKEVVIEKTSLEQEVNDSEAYYEEKLRELLDEEELKQLAAKAWENIISVNGQEFKGNMQYISSESMTILVAEVIRDETLLPADIAKLGCLEQEAEGRKLIDYIKVYSEVPYKVERVKGEDGIKYHLKFENLPNGTIITLQLSDTLKSRMHYNDKITEDRLAIVKRME